MPGNKNEDLEYIKGYKPHNSELQHVRILLHGPVGAGKSSFINSVDSALQGRIKGRASDDGACGKSYSTKYTTYRIPKENHTSFYPFVFNDIMGIEQDDAGICVEDIKLALMGHVRDGYKFKPETPLSDEDESYNESPTLNDKVHVLVCIVPADKLSITSDEVFKKLRKVRLAACDLGIPQLAVVTKIEEACFYTEKCVGNAYRSRYLRDMVEKVYTSQGFSRNRIFLVKNYHSEVSINDDVDTLILSTLKQIITYAEDFANDMQNLHEHGKSYPIKP